MAAIRRASTGESGEIDGYFYFRRRRFGFGIEPPKCGTCCPACRPRERDISRSRQAPAALSDRKLSRCGQRRRAGGRCTRFECANGWRPRKQYGMSDTKNPGEKKLTLSLKPRTETGVVRQSFSHGRSKQVVVEVKKRRTVGGPEAKAEPRAGRSAEESRCRATPAAAPPQAAPEPKSGVVLRTLTEEERVARAHALADSKVREAEERKIAEEEARRRASKEGIERSRARSRRSAQARGRSAPQASRKKPSARPAKSPRSASLRGRSQEAGAAGRRSSKPRKMTARACRAVPARPALPVRPPPVRPRRARRRRKNAAA